MSPFPSHTRLCETTVSHQRVDFTNEITINFTIKFYTIPKHVIINIRNTIQVFATRGPGTSQFLSLGTDSPGCIAASKISSTEFHLQLQHQTPRHGSIYTFIAGNKQMGHTHTITWSLLKIRSFLFFSTETKCVLKTFLLSFVVLFIRYSFTLCFFQPDIFAKKNDKNIINVFFEFLKYRQFFWH